MSYEKLTKRQKEFFDLYVENRSVWKTAKELGISEGNANQIFKSNRVSEALEEYNNELKNKTLYNEAVIIDELWKLYNDENASVRDKRDTLVWLGKHIGMWSTQATQEKAAPSIQYNVVNYNQIAQTVQEHEDEIIEAELEVVEEHNNQFLIKDYSKTVQ